MYICKKDFKMINEVRNTVLSVLNKNNYGYISPSDFNLYAVNAQMEIFEDYFSGYNKAINMENARMAGSDYAEVEGPLAETVETFLVTNFLSHIAGNIYSAPSPTTTGDTAYYILKMICHSRQITAGLTTGIAVNGLVNTSAQFTTLGIVPGDIVVNANTGAVSTVVNVLSNTQLILSSNIFTVVGQLYFIYSKEAKEAEKVSVGKITMLNNSLLTQPNNMFPSYTLEADKIKIYPETINAKGKVECVYFRHPLPPKWTYITLANGEPVFDQSQPDYQDFELPDEDVYRLVMKILQYCGISIRETEVAAFAIGQEQQNNQQ
jgi:hypothetical protein